LKTDSANLLQDLAAYLLAAPKNPATLKKTAEMVRAERNYRWVGIYKIERGDFIIAVGTGDQPPTYKRFPITQGLCGAAAEARETLIVGDVRKDARWLPAFWSTQSEIIVPIVSEMNGRVLGVIDVESDKLDAFGDDDRDFLEHVAALMAGKLCTAKKRRNAPAH
jgi:GAF domain-containing protein